MLTTKQIDNAKPKKKLYRIFDALGLYIEIDPSGGKYWRVNTILRENRDGSPSVDIPKSPYWKPARNAIKPVS